MGNYLSWFSSQRKETINSEASLVSAGNHAQSIFIAIATGILDSLLVREHSRQTDNVIKALRRYFTVPANNSQLLVTPYQQIQQWLVLDAAGLIHALAHVFRQDTVNIWKKQPEKYIRAFLDPYDELSLEQMRQTDTPLDLYCSLAAIAESWDIPIILRENLPDRKAVGLRLNFETNKQNVMTNPLIILHKQQSNLASQVRSTAYFENISTASTLPWISNEISHDDDSTKLFDAITAEKKRCLIDFYHHQSHLRAIVEAKQLSMSDLIDFYLAGLKNFQNSTYRPACTERGHQRLFEQICSNISIKPLVTLPFDMQIRQSTIASIALLASIGRLSSFIDDYRNYHEKGHACEPPKSVTTY